MNALTTKPSWFWGQTPVRIKWIFWSSILFSLASLLMIGIFIWRDVVWKYEATHFAAEAGVTDAKKYYSHGSHRLLEIALINEDKVDSGPIATIYETKPAGRQREGCEVYYLFQSPFMGAPHRVAQESYLRAFNHMMRTMCANPDWFGPHGDRLSADEGQTNLPPFKVIPE